MVPVVYKLASDGVPVSVFSLEPLLEIAADYRLQFLRERWQVPVQYVYEAHAPSLAHRLVGRLLCSRIVRRATRARLRALWAQRGRAARHWWLELLAVLPLMVYRTWLFVWLYERLWRPLLYNQEWADSFIERLGPRLLVFDWVSPRKFMIRALMQGARARGVRSVAVPHGVHMVTDELRAEQAMRAGHVKRAWPVADYDGVAVPEPLFRDFLARTNVAAEKIEVLGSPRFCDEWERAHDTIAPPSRVPPGLGAGKLKVVYMDKRFRSRMHPAAVLGALRELAALPGIELVIKPETRGNFPASPEMAEFALIASDIPSLDLIRWADVIIGVHSSVLLEVLVQRKVLVYPKFFSDNVTFFEDYAACWVVETPQALLAAVRRLSDDLGFRPYPQENAERLLTDVVYGGVRGRSVLGAYRDFLLRHARLAEGAPAATTA